MCVSGSTRSKLASQRYWYWSFLWSSISCWFFFHKAQLSTEQSDRFQSSIIIIILEHYCKKFVHILAPLINVFNSTCFFQISQRLVLPHTIQVTYLMLLCALIFSKQIMLLIQARPTGYVCINLCLKAIGRKAKWVNSNITHYNYLFCLPLTHNYCTINICG